MILDLLRLTAVAGTEALSLTGFSREVHLMNVVEHNFTSSLVDIILNEHLSGSTALKSSYVSSRTPSKFFAKAGD